MHLDLPSLWFAILNLQPWSIAIVVPIVGMIFAGVLIISLWYFNHRRTVLWHETARIALEKGQPLPPVPEEREPKRSQKSGDAPDDIRAGLICIAVGAALYLFFGSLIGGLGYVGAIPGFIGVALLLFGVIRSVTERKSSSNDDDRPNQS